MRDQELVRRLVSNLDATAAGSFHMPLRLAALTALSSLTSLALIVLLLSRSPHLAHGPGATIIVAVLSAGVLALGAALTAVRLSYPEGRTRLRWLAMPVAILAGGIALELSDAPRSTWSSRFWGENPLACFLLVYALALPILAAVLFALRAGATSHPRVSGAMAGLVAGGIAAALYTLHCPENSLLFTGTWHVLAVLGLTACGALAGDRLLRW
jgi:hypothetical protein